MFKSYREFVLQKLNNSHFLTPHVAFDLNVMILSIKCRERGYLLSSLEFKTYSTCCRDPETLVIIPGHSCVC